LFYTQGQPSPELPIHIVIVGLARPKWLAFPCQTQPLFKQLTRDEIIVRQFHFEAVSSFNQPAGSNFSTCLHRNTTRYMILQK